MIDRRTVLSAGLAAMAGCGREKGAGFDGHAFVANEEGRTVAVVDLLSFSVTRQIPLPGRPTAVIAHSGRGPVFVLTPQTGTVHEINPSRLAVERTAKVAGGAVSMRLAPDGAALWVLCREPRELVRVALEPLRPDSRIALPAEPFDFDLSPNGQLCAVSFGIHGTVSVFQTGGRRAGRQIPLGNTAGPVRFRSDGRHLLAGNAGDRMLSILEALTGRVVVHLPLALRPDNFCFNSDGGQLFVTGEGMDAVVVVYPYSTEVAGTVLAGRTPGAMAASDSPDHQYLFVANRESGSLTVLNIETQRVIASLTVGEEPAYITVTPDNQYALVLNRRSGNVAVVRIPALVPKRTRAAPLFTMIPVGSQPVSAAVRAT